MARDRKQLSSVLIKPAGPDCNLACRYCFYLEKDRIFAETKIHRMDAVVLEATVRQVMIYSGPNLSFGWQGGEPTLMGVEFFKQAVEFEKQYGGAGQTVGNGLQTNGVLIDAEWSRFLSEAKFLVGLSLDGPEHVHDHYRRFRDGGPSWRRVVDAGRRMLDAGVEVNALTVVNDYSARFPREIYDFHKQQGLAFMQFIPCLEPDADDPSRPASFSVSPALFGAFLCEVFDCWLADFEDERPTTSVRWFDSVFATYVDIAPPECTLTAECGEYVVIEHNGDVFSCDFFVEPDWRLGNVLTGELFDMLNSPRQATFGRRKADLSHACQTCRWLKHCRGGCPKERWGDPSDAKLSRHCQAYQLFFEHADAKLRGLAADWLQEQRRQPLASSPGMSEAEAPMAPRAGRNDPCPCGSGAKYKRCCGRDGGV